MPIVVRRSLFKTGDSLAVTLPKAWIRFFKLRPGDHVLIVANEHIIIKAEKEKTENIDYYKDLTA